jgi:hypothetical protein
MKTLLLAVALVAVQCGAPKPAPSSVTCSDACKNLSRLGCEEAQPTASGASCEEVCQNAELPVACIAQASSCDAANACE